MRSSSNNCERSPRKDSRDAEDLRSGAIVVTLNSEFEMFGSRFEWYEKVRVNSDDPARAQINGELGVVLGKAQADDGSWTYGVHVYRTQIVWSCCEDELTATGEFDRRDSFYNDDSIRVSLCGELLH